MSARKLQQEFDKANKKISEGLTLFDDIYDKLMTTEVSSQKEKLESDLKKEIKRLQRSRDQLKTWLGDTSIKLDKNSLQEKRTRIEHAMDLFKDLEKTSKIKQFSNEGLELQSQRTRSRGNFGPDDSKKSESCNYISDVIDQLNQQSETLEVDMHQLTLQLKKAKSSNAGPIQQSIDDSKYKIERNNAHLTKLEKILRNLENENLDPEKVDLIKDDLEYYVENNQEDDYVEYDDFYDALEMSDDTLDVQGSLSQVPGAERSSSQEPPDFDQEKKGDDTDAGSTFAAVKQTHVSELPVDREKERMSSQEKPEKIPVKPEGKTIASTLASSISKSTKPNVVPAPALPPLTGANSYSNVIKAAVAQSTSSPSTAEATTPGSKVPPPGLNPSNKSSTASPLFAKPSTEPVQEKQKVQPEEASPFMTSGDKLFSDTINRFLTVHQSRLQDPLPFQSISPLLESSLLNCPDSFDAERPRQYNPLNVHPSSIDYPQEPMHELNSSHIMRKFDNDTLFFCFYYSEDADKLAKWNAARELSRRGWIFNLETKQWFLKDTKVGGKTRSSSPEAFNSPGRGDSEENYKYFDYEKTWLIRRREGYKLDPELRETF